MLRLAMCATLLCGAATFVLAQQTPGKTATVTCTFQDGKELSLRYNTESSNGKVRLPEGKIWSPGGKPMFLFTQVELLVGNAEIPMGAYSAYITQQRASWTLVLNKNVTDGSKYNEQEDLLRAPMQAGQLSDPQPFSVAFAHVGPKQCNLRLYLGKAGTWVEFKEK